MCVLCIVVVNSRNVLFCWKRQYRNVDYCLIYFGWMLGINKQNKRIE